MPISSRVTVLVSGGDAVTPFTTPQLACASGLAAGNTATALRDAFLDAGIDVFTAPAMNGRGPVREPRSDEFGAFGGMPVVLPAHMTIISTGDIDNSGEHLARFAQHLHDEYGVSEIDWVGHSNGGLFARAATRILQETAAPIAVRSLTTLGTPWHGSNPLRILAGELDESVAANDQVCQTFLTAFKEHEHRALGLQHQNTRSYLDGGHGWNVAQAGVLDEIPVLLVAGTALHEAGGEPEYWPHDGLVSEHSALASELGADVLPIRRAVSYPLLHSIYIAEVLGESWQLGMTWNPNVLQQVVDFVLEMRGASHQSPGGYGVASAGGSAGRAS